MYSFVWFYVRFWGCGVFKIWFLFMRVRSLGGEVGKRYMVGSFYFSDGERFCFDDFFLSRFFG